MPGPNDSYPTLPAQPTKNPPPPPGIETEDSRATAPPQPAGAGGPPAAVAPPGLPERIGRYRVERVLGEGTFGRVYLAHDDELNRAVAVKVPHRERVARPEDVEAYLAEARTLAGLDHPHIVPVYDVGRTDDGLCFVVSKYVPGSDLKGRIKQARLSPAEAADLIAMVAEGLHHAHRRGLVHRDVKPANILLDQAGRPYVADFGLALHDEDFGRGPGWAGTPAYMSPEQAGGEGHRVDGRSDIFSLGIVFYELLTGHRPFRGGTREELLEQIRTVEARPPRQLDETLPRELERICLKALAKRISERYTTASDLADDLRHFLAPAPAGSSGGTALPSRPDGSGEPSHPIAPVGPPPGAVPGPVKVVPKGLRSFDAHDAYFFLELVPGPRDRDGLPESIRFWKSQVEERDPDRTFPVGLLYGPSGCGKSSLVKAGLLPRLAESVLPVYVEATAAETEARLLRGVRKHCPDLPANLGLKETLAALRRGQGLPPGKKVLLVLDQFEQWLHAHRAEDDAELVGALRQCDGRRVQALLLVRVDFWLGVSRLLARLDVELLPGHNAALVDLFDGLHARGVLAAFGRAFGRLGESLTREQEAFLDQAVRGLSQDGRVVCVRLALFAEMVKGRPWTPATLKEVGGTAGVGVTFLEETFGSAAGPRNRQHQPAARAVLQALLPEPGADIKGNMLSHDRLLEVSGYERRPREFAELLRILDTEVRLLTPTEPEEKEEGGRRKEESKEGPSDSSFLLHPSSFQYYQLTHDYLVPSLREWLARKQKETRRGRAELRLAERAAAWNAKPENRHLPAWWEWLNIRLCTRTRDWTPPQRKMMRKAARYHGARGLALAVLLAVATVTGLVVRDRVIEQGKADHAAALVQGLLNADIAQVPEIIGKVESYRRWADPLLKQENDRARDDSRAKLYTSLALLPGDHGQVAYLYRQLLRASPPEVKVLREALSGHRAALVGRLWRVAEDGKADPGQRFRAACALAAYDAESRRWPDIASFVADRLLAAVQENPSHYDPLLNLLRPVGARLLDPLAMVFRQGDRPEGDRTWAASFLAEYAAGRPELLADLLQDAGAKQFAVLFPKAEGHKEKVVPILRATVGTDLKTRKAEPEKERLAKRQANAAAALLRLGQPEPAWKLLKHTPDPRARSYLIHRLGPLGVDPQVLIQRLEEEKEVSVRRALLLALGEFGKDQLPAAEREALVPRILRLYQDDPDPGLHGAAEWLLRTWKQDQALTAMTEQWAKGKPQREERLIRLGQELSRPPGKARPQWYVNSQGQTMVVIPRPEKFFWMGSPTTEDGRNADERLHKKRIGRSFAIAAKPVTVKDFQIFLRAKKLEVWFQAGGQAAPLMKKYSPGPEGPIILVDWHRAAAYCNWLSAQEGLPPCYETDARGQVTKLKENYLSLEGYRLPTEAEWEYACRAGAGTARYYGETEELLKKYAWYLDNSKNRTHRVGALKPNDLGLFDMHGNVWCWCQERKKDYPEETQKEYEDIEDKLSINNQEGRVLRGGSFDDPAVHVRSADRLRYVPTDRSDDVGFRPARTFTAE